MKKAAKIIGMTVAALLIIVITSVLIVPVAFKGKIKVKVENTANNMLQAKVTFKDYKLSLVRAFPNATFSVNDLSVVGIDKFEGDTLAAIKSFDLVFNLMSIFSDKGYEVKSIIINRPLLNALVLEDGSANWDIMKETEIETEVEAEKEGSTSSLRLQLKKFAIIDGRIYYSDLESNMAAAIERLGFLLSGNMSTTRSDLKVDLTTEGVTFVMDKVKYLSKATVNFHSDVDAQLDSMIFKLKDNSFNINDIVLNWSGSVAMPGDDIAADLVFNTPNTSFKSLLSLVPAVYMKGFESLKASGTFSLDGAIKGVYSSTDSTLPDIDLKLLVNDGVISYPDLPEKISAVGINAVVAMDGKEMDKTVVDVTKFHFELAGNPFDMTMNLTSPISDPSITAGARGKIDLTKLQQAIPLDSISLNGLIDLSVSLSGRMSMIEEKKYEQFKADGALAISNMALEMPDLPAVKINNASFTFAPAYSELKQLNMKVGERSDFSISGKLENYIPYLFSDGIIKGNLSLVSQSLDLNEIMDKIPADTTAVEDTTALAVIHVPENIDFTFNALIGKLVFQKLAATDVKGNIIVRNGVVTVRETGMNALGGSLLVNADYDTRDTLKPVIKADMKISSVSIKEAFNTFNSVQKLAPAAKGLGGNISLGMKYESLLGENMMPLISSITGGGELKSEMVQILESKTFDQMKSVLSLKSGYTNMVKDLKANFEINNGRVYIKPFDTKLGSIKMNIAGDQGIDKTLNYVIKAEIPRAELGESANALVTGLAAQASLLGINYMPSDIIKLNLKVGGTFNKPVITPLFSGINESGSPVTAVTTAVKEEAKEVVKEEIGEQADKIIREAEEQAQKLKDQAAASAKMIREEADLRGQKLVKDAEPKGTMAVIAAKKAAELLRKEADKKATLLETEANAKADKLLAEARAKAEGLSK